MNREQKLNEFVGTYIQNRDSNNEGSVMDFHRKHLLIYLHRVHAFASEYPTSETSLRSGTSFLMVEVATTVARADWIGGKNNEKDCRGFSEYFDAYDEMTSGSTPLAQAAESCIEALTVS